MLLTVAAASAVPTCDISQTPMRQHMQPRSQACCCCNTKQTTYCKSTHSKPIYQICIHRITPMYHYSCQSIRTPHRLESPPPHDFPSPSFNEICQPGSAQRCHCKGTTAATPSHTYATTIGSPIVSANSCTAVLTESCLKAPSWSLLGSRGAGNVVDGRHWADGVLRVGICGVVKVDTVSNGCWVGHKASLQQQREHKQEVRECLAYQSV